MATYLIPRLAEQTINIIIRLPNAGHTLAIVPEPIFKRRAQFRSQDRIRRLLVDFGTQGQPGLSAQGAQCEVVLFFGAVEA